jgi:menaquinone-dependent protoporphyrinogen oxidase
LTTNQNRVLIVYGTRFGATEGTVKEMQKTLTENNLDVTVVNLRKTSVNQWPDPAEFSGVIVGSGIKIGRWTAESKKFLKMNAENIRTNNLKLAVFVSSGYAADPLLYEEIKEKYVKNIIEDYNITATMFDAFGGLLDLSTQSKLGFVDRNLARSGFKLGAKSKDLGFKPNQINDFRDWEQIKDFTIKFCEIIKA